MKDFRLALALCAGADYFCAELAKKFLRKITKILDKGEVVWYIIARKGESDVLRSLPQPDAEVEANDKSEI